MFAVGEVTLDAPFDTAAVRLVSLLQEGALNGVCDGAYQGGLTAVLRVGPSGRFRGVSKLVRVCFLEPVRRGSTVTVALRWEATGAAGELFPVLDADLVLTRHGDGQALLALTGSYRPPFGLAGDLLDKAVMHRLASATIRSLLDSLSGAITRPALPPEPAAGPPSWPQAATEPGQL